MTSCINATSRNTLPATSSLKGVMRPVDGARHFLLRRFPAGQVVAGYVENYWSVRWDLAAGQRYRSEVIPHPCVHMSVESGSPGEVRHGYPMPQALLHGVRNRRFTIDLTGAGRVLGVRFRPGGLSALTGLDAYALRNRVIPLRQVFGPAGDVLAGQVLAEQDDGPRVALAEAFLAGRLPAADPAYDQVLTIVAAMLDDRALVRVDQVTRAFGISARTLQRLFRRYVGAPPKWVLARYRIHDAAARLESEPGVLAADVAADAGYFDQAHFCRDFKALLGVTPAQYAAQCHPAGAGQRGPAVTGPAGSAAVPASS